MDVLRSTGKFLSISLSFSLSHTQIIRKMKGQNKQSWRALTTKGLNHVESINTDSKTFARIPNKTSTPLPRAGKFLTRYFVLT